MTTQPPPQSQSTMTCVSSETPIALSPPEQSQVPTKNKQPSQQTAENDSSDSEFCVDDVDTDMSDSDEDEEEEDEEEEFDTDVSSESYGDDEEEDDTVESSNIKKTKMLPAKALSHHNVGKKNKLPQQELAEKGNPSGSPQTITPQRKPDKKAAPVSSSTNNRNNIPIDIISHTSSNRVDRRKSPSVVSSRAGKYVGASSQKRALSGETIIMNLMLHPDEKFSQLGRALKELGFDNPTTFLSAHRQIGERQKFAQWYIEHAPFPREFLASEDKMFSGWKLWPMFIRHLCSFAINYRDNAVSTHQDFFINWANESQDG